MYGLQVLKVIGSLLLVALLVACQPVDFSKLKDDKGFLTGLENKFSKITRPHVTNNLSDRPKPLLDILKGSLASNNGGSNFTSSVKYALDTDPFIVTKRREAEAKRAAVAAREAQKDFQVNSTFYGGVEDVTDNTKGLALSLSASRSIYDGGRLDFLIETARFGALEADMAVLAALDKRAYELCELWLELEKYKTLQAQIDKRLSVLDPLIDQLEQVAKAGIGDVSKVTAAQRTVAAIRVEQTNISENLSRAQLNFSNAFGTVSDGIVFDYDFITGLVPEKIDNNLIRSAPSLRAKYAAYQASVARANALRAKEKFDIGFEARAMRPFAGSGYDSDESIGFVGRKTLYNGGLLDSDIKEAEVTVQAAAAQIKSIYRDGARTVRTAQQNIESMEIAIRMAKENAKLTADEIVYLKQQLVIGGSTLDSVLSAEARLYEADSKEINYLAEKQKSELVIVSTLGLLSTAFGY